MKPRDQSLNNFTEKLFVTHQQENPCEDSGFSSNNQDAPHQQNICYRNDSQQSQPLQSTHKDQFLQPKIHHRSQKADLCPQPPLPVEHTKEEQSTQCLNRLQQTTTEIQSTPTDLVPPSSNFLSTPDDHHELCSFLNPNEQHLHFKKQRLNERQQNNTNQWKTNHRTNLFMSYRRIYQQVFHCRQLALYQQLRRSNTSQQKDKLVFVINFPHQISAQQE